MTFCLISPVIKALLCVSKYQRHKTIRVIKYCITKNYNVLSSKKLETPIRYISVGTVKISDKIDNSVSVPDEDSEMVTYSVKNLKTNDIVVVKGRIGETLMEATANFIPDVHGACGGSRACTTCHMYMDEELEDSLPEPLDEEQDMLDKAAFLKPNSRLSCQVIITKEFEGKTFATPIGTVNMAVDSQVSKKH